MGMSKADFFADHDVFIAYDFEDVMFRWDATSRKVYRKFKDQNVEIEVSHDNKLLNDSVLFGGTSTKEQYFGGLAEQSSDDA